MESGKFLWSTLKHSNSSYLRTVKNRRACLFNSALSRYSTESAQAPEVVVKEKIHLTKPSVVKWKRPPFVKNFFFGKFDIELMAFPEILDKEQVFELEGNVKSINDYMREKVNSIEIDMKEEIPRDVLQDMKDMGLFGRMIPSKYGGLDLTYTACTRLNEVIGLDWSVCSTLLAHEFFATQAILKFGSEEQKAHYLPKLASGDTIAALCCSEIESGNDILSIATTATENTDGTYVINGTKTWVTNAELAGVFVVFAKTPNTINPNLTEISAFIVDKDAKGLCIEPQNKVCLRGMKVGTVHFKEVVVPASNVIGKLGIGVHIYVKALESFRIAQNSFTFGALKALLDSVTERVIQNERVEKSLGDHQLVRCRLSRINSMIYGMESAAYFTAAILDSSENPDIALESAALKVFNSEGTLYCIRELMELVGSQSLMPGMLLERFYRDAVGLSMFDTPNDVVKLYLGLVGCQMVGAKKAEVIVQRRNRLHFPIETVKQRIRHWRIGRGQIKFDQDIGGHLHPSLVEWANNLEKSLQIFELAVENVLEMHGSKVVETQIDPIRLANIAADLYAWSAVLSRCSRSYCNGHKNSHHELRLVYAFCYDMNERVQRNYREIALGITENNQKNHLLLGEQVIDCQGYFPEHPLKHNF